MNPVSRGRREKRISGDERERSILDTAERLMRSQPFHEISVDELAQGAGITRPTFYFYFSSKDAVLLSLLDAMTAQADRARGDALDQLAADPRAGWRQVIDAFYSVLGRHRHLVLAGARARSANPEVAELWTRLMNRWIAEAVSAIEAERARGAAPDGSAAVDIATSLIYMNERVLLATFAGERPGIAEDRIVDVLVDVWLGAIYRAGTFDGAAVG